MPYIISSFTMHALPDISISAYSKLNVGIFLLPRESKTNFGASCIVFYLVSAKPFIIARYN